MISSSWGATGLALSNTIRDCFDFLTTYGRGGRGCVLCFSLGNTGYLDFTNLRVPVANRIMRAYLGLDAPAQVDSSSGPGENR